MLLSIIRIIIISFHSIQQALLKTLSHLFRGQDLRPIFLEKEPRRMMSAQGQIEKTAGTPRPTEAIALGRFNISDIINIIIHIIGDIVPRTSNVTRGNFA